MRRVRLGGLAAGLLLVGAGLWAGLPGGRAGLGAQPAGPLPGKVVYDQHCASCHGATGGADGPAAAALPIKPPPFTDGHRINPLPDEFMVTVITKGAAAVGLAPQMPAFQPPLTDRQVRDVIVYVRSMAAPPYQPPPPAPAPLAPAPVQPIEFSHVVHAGSYGLACQYCHADARRSSYAGLPSVQRCMGCHKLVAAQGNPEVGKLQQYAQRGEAIPWVRIHKLAGFVHFPHKRHVQVGLACQACHGPVERMQRVAQIAPLTMGWCVQCHSERRGPLDCVTCHH